MTVKQLKELLSDAPDDMIVYVNEEYALGGFMFKESCPELSGVAKFGPPDENSGEVGEAQEGFIIMAHGAGVSEDDIDDNERSEVLN